MSIKPQVKVECLEELQRIIDRNERPTDFEVARFRKQANDAISTDRPWIGWVMRSALEAALWNPEAALDVVQRAEKAVGRNSDALGNLAISLKHLCLMDRALTLMQRAHAIDPLDPRTLGHLAGILYALGMMEDATALVREYLRLAGPSGDASAKTSLIELERVNEGLKRANIPEARLREECSIALEVLRAAKTRWLILEIEFQTDPDSGEEALLARYTFHGDIEHEMRLGAMLAERLAETENWNPTKLSVDFAYVEREDAVVTA
jgi:tetratricopeptide (TPR) repeat protein